MFLAQQGQLHDLQEEGSVYILPVACHRKLVSGNFHESELYDRLISVFLVGANVPGIGHDGPNTRAVCCLRRSQMRFARTLFECHCRVLLKQAVGCFVYVATQA